MTFNIMTSSTMTLNITNKKGNTHNITFGIIILKNNSVIQSPLFLNVMLGVFILNVVMLSVAAPL